MRGLTRRTVALAVLLFGCNPYNHDLPPPRCRTAHDCVPGSRCRDDHCETVGEARIYIGPHESPVHLWIVAAGPSGEPPWVSSGARMVARAALSSDELAYERAELPELPRYVIAWEGEAASPCGAVRTAAARLTDERRGVAILSLSSTEPVCFRQPPSLDWADIVTRR